MLTVSNPRKTTLYAHLFYSVQSSTIGPWNEKMKMNGTKMFDMHGTELNIQDSQTYFMSIDQRIFFAMNLKHTIIVDHIWKIVHVSF
jgi:hypothetical protein